MTIKDKQFKSYISELQIQTAVKNVSSLINVDLKNELPIFLVVLNGAFMFASDLLKEINIPCEISFVKVASYDGIGSKGAIDELIGLTENVSGRTVVIVEDIIDTGLTIEHIKRILKQKNAKNIKVATAFMKPDSYKQAHVIDYVGIKIKNEFVVGYGLDYNGQGRNLKELYTLT
jgi:hypoxanthine phosphoribosyltransferase